MAEQALAHVRQALLSGAYIAVQDEGGRMFFGTAAEAARYIMEQATA